MENKKVVQVVGLGRIGLCFSVLISATSFGVVRGVDVDVKHLDEIKNFFVYPDEPELNEMLMSSIGDGHLIISNEIVNADVYVVAVNTTDKNLKPSDELVQNVIRSLLPILKKGDLIIVLSTLLQGGAAQIISLISNGRPDLQSDIFFAYSPERGNPGELISDIRCNNRVIGVNKKESYELVKAFMSTFVRGEFFEATFEEAEFSKIAENAFRYLMIAFSNEISMFLRTEIDVLRVIGLINTSKRINLLSPSVGAGGSCLPVDAQRYMESLTAKSYLLDAAESINFYKRYWCVRSILSKIDQLKLLGIFQPVVGIFGLTYKPNFSDIRNSVAAEVAEIIYNIKNIRTLFVEPNISSHNLFVLSDINTALDKSDLIVFLVAHDDFIGLNISHEKEVLDFVGVGSRRV